MRSIHLQLPAEMFARIEKARRTPLGEINRNAWIRDAIEMQLRLAENAQEMAKDPTGRHAREAIKRVQHVPGPNVENIRSSSQRSHAPNCKCPVCK